MSFTYPFTILFGSGDPPCTIRILAGTTLHTALAFSLARAFLSEAFSPVGAAGIAGVGIPAGAIAQSSSTILSFSDTTSTRRESRSEEHTSELQSLRHLVCRLLLEKKKKT